MRLLVCAILIASLWTARCNSTSAQELPALFNGKDLKGWKLPKDEKVRNCWQVEKGVIIARSEPQKLGSILWTKKEFRNFVLELDFKMGAGTIDSGVFLRNIDEQIQIGISGSLKRDMTASPYIAKAGGYPVEAEGIEELLKPKDWNSLTIVAKGSDYTAWLNGKFVMHYRSKTAIDKGPIGLQIHPNNEMTIEFRKLRLAELR